MGPDYYIAGLIDRGMPPHIAKGFVANFIAESGLKPGINEIAPVVPGSRGGYGLYQLTGPRRRQYEAWAADRGVALDDPDAQMDFLMMELQTTEKGAWSKIQGATDAVEAARLVSDKFLRPGIPNMEKRLQLASELSGMEAEGAGRIDRNPARLAWAYANGKMTPEDAALYEKGVADGKFPAAKKQEPSPLQTYAQQIAQRNASRRPVQFGQLDVPDAINATPFRPFPGLGQ